jgi:hypothetical protein
VVEDGDLALEHEGIERQGADRFGDTPEPLGVLDAGPA